MGRISAHRLPSRGLITPDNSQVRAIRIGDLAWIVQLAPFRSNVPVLPAPLQAEAPTTNSSSLPGQPIRLTKAVQIILFGA